jgi:hypothetical protein
MKRKSIQSIAAPLLFAAYSVLALYTHNLGEVHPASVYRSLVVALLLAVIITLIFRFLYQEWAKAGLMATFSLFYLLAYGHVYNLVRSLDWAASLGRHRVLLPVWALLLLGISILLLKRDKGVENLNRVLNVVMGALILFPLITLGRYTIGQSIAKQSYQASEAPTMPGFRLPDNPPDIYYILLDGYTRADVLYTKFGFDNSGFIESLEDFGFYVADCSRSNYEHTHLTLPSLMNMAYIDQLIDDIPPGASVENLRFDDLTRNNQVMEIFTDIGYETVAFENSYYWAQFSEADIYYEPLKVRFFTPSLSEFEEIYLDTTLVYALRDWALIREKPFFEMSVNPEKTHALRIQFALEKLKELPDLKGPQFVMAHLVIPHPPYIFDQDGVISNIYAYDESWEDGELGQAGYRDNIRFINQQVLQVVDEILEKSSTPPIIILQADHGSSFCDRTMIFSAFYLPRVGSQTLYPHITPVNTFRLVLKQVFDAPYDLLPDRTFSGKYPPFNFELIEETYLDCRQN